MTGWMALAGGDEFREDSRQMDRRLLEVVGKSNPRVVMIPTAIRNNPKMMAANGAFYFRTLNADPSAAMVLTRDDATNPRLFESLDRADVAYLIGSDPTHLMGVLTGTPLLIALRAVYDRGGLIVGSNAGAMVLSLFMREWNTGAWKAGLGWLKVAILVQHHVGTTQMLALNAPQETPVIGIAEGTAVFTSDGKAWEVAGGGFVTRYARGIPQRHKHGDTFILDK